MQIIHFYHTTAPYGFLGNFYRSPMILDGKLWPTAEHYYQAQKFPHDPAKQEAIRLTPRPGDAKRLAWESAAGFRPDWDAIRGDVMLRANRAKYQQNPDLAAQMLATGRTPIAEHVKADPYWDDQLDGSGQNRLGEILMQIRAELAAEEQALGRSANRAIFEWLMQTGKVKAQRGPVFDTTPARHTGLRWPRVEGMMVGLAIGDALGKGSESKRPAVRRAGFGEIRDYLPSPLAGGQRVGLPSDDTQLAAWMLEQINRDGGLVPDHLARIYASRRIYGIGSTVKEFIGRFRERGLPWQECGPASAGNGALMRIAPVLIPHLRTPSSELWSDTLLAAMVTHNDSASNAACVAFVALLWDLLGMTESPAPYWWLERFVEVARQVETETAYTPRKSELAHEQSTLSDFAERHLSDAWARGLDTRAACETWHSGAFLLETLPSALYILMRHGHEAEEAIVRAVNDTRDNDTVAAIVGAAVGALHGVEALPQRWRDGLLGRTQEDDDGALFALLANAKTLWFDGGS